MEREIGSTIGNISARFSIALYLTQSVVSFDWMEAENDDEFSFAGRSPSHPFRKLDRVESRLCRNGQGINGNIVYSDWTAD
jgi:hypothetical protein